MLCTQCDQKAAISCCSNLLFCHLHFGQHFSIKMIHSPHQIIYRLDPIKDSMLTSELLSRISSLKDAISKIRFTTKSLINTIESLQDFYVKELNSTIHKYQEMLKTREFSDIEEIEEILETDMKVNYIRSEDLIEAVRGFFQNVLLKFDVNLDKESEIKKNKFLKEHNGGFLCLAVARDGKIIVTGSEDTTVRVWDLKEKKQIAFYSQHKSDVICVAIDRDSRYVVSGSRDRTLVLMDLKRYCFKFRFKGHTGCVCCVGFSLDENLMVSGSYSNEIRIWNFKSFECIGNTKTDFPIYCLLVLSNDEFFTGSKNFLQKWRFDSLKNPLTIEAHADTISSIGKTSNNYLLITGSDDSTIKLWKIPSLEIYATLLGHSASIKSISITPDDSKLISSSENDLIIVWSLKSLSQTHSFTFHNDVILSIKCSQDLIISVSRDARIGIINSSSMVFDSYISLKPYTVRAQELKENFLAYGSLNTVAVWSPDEKEIILEGHKDLVQAVCFSSDMQILISASLGASSNLIVWDLLKNSQKAILDGHEESVFCVDISEDNLNAISGDAFAKVCFWDLAKMVKICEFWGHEDDVYTVKFTKNKKFAASGGSDKNVILWDIERKVLHAVLAGHQGFVWKVLITDDDQQVVSGSFKEGIRVWNIKEMKMDFWFETLEESKIWIEKNRNMKDEFSRFLFDNFDR